MAHKRIRLPFEDVRLSDAEIAITQTRVFQRLFDLKQLGLAYLVYPNATHKRGTHSIRCLGEAIKILNGLRHNGEVISDEDEQKIRITALLHDIGHLPFSHTLEDEHVILRKHDRSARLERVLEALQKELDPKYVDLVNTAKPILVAISEPEGSDADWRSDLVGNTICADLLAYITADAEAAGIEKRSGHYRVYEYFQRHANRLCIRLTKGGIRTDIVSAIIDLLDMRFCLTERVISHHAKCVASAMLARASRLADLSDADEARLIQLGDEGFLQYVDGKAESMSDPSNVARQGTLRLLYCLRARRLYQRIFKIGQHARNNWDASCGQNAFCTKWRDGTEIENLLKELEESHNLPLGSLVLWCPENRAGMKLVKAKVIYETTAGIQGPKALRDILEFGEHFRGVKERVETMENIYRDLWTFWVAIDRKHIDRAPDVVRALEDKLEIQCDRVFRDTYLDKLKGFEVRRHLLDKVQQVQSELLPAVLESVTQQSALSGDPSADSGAIMEAIKAAAEKKAPRKTGKKQAKGQKKPTEDQPTFLPGDSAVSEDAAQSDEEEK